MIERTAAIKRALSAAGRRWQSFWFQPQEMYTLGLVRIGFGALVIVWTLWLIPVRTELLGPNGVTPRQPSIPDTWGVFAVWNSDTAIVIGIVVLLAAALALLIGWHSRIAALLVFVLILSFERRSPWIFNSGDVLMRIEAFLLAIAPCGAALSLDQRRRAEGFWSAQTRPTWPIRLFQVQLSIAYLAAAQAKLAGQPWLHGTAVSYVLRVEDMKRIPVPQWLTTNAILMNATTWSVIAVELSLAFLLWIPRFRPWVLAAGVLMHMSIDLSIQIGIFSYAMFVMYLAWISPETVRTFPDKLRQRQWPWRSSRASPETEALPSDDALDSS